MINSLRTIHDSAFNVLLRLAVPFELAVVPGRAGFFGAVFATLNGIRFAELRGRRASVVWGRASPYFDARRGPNAWEMFFCNGSFDFSRSPFGAAVRLSFRPGAHDFFPYDGLSVRSSVARAIRLWCEPRPEIVDAVDRFVSLRFGRAPVLGVHVRLTDAASGAEGRRAIETRHIVAAVDSWLVDNPSGSVFLASDDQRVVEAFGSRYSGRLLYQDCIRSSDGLSIHGHYDSGVSGDPYRKGRDVLIDALLLARCAHLIRTHSRVTAFSLCFNPDLTYRDLERELLGVDRTPWLHGS